MATSFSYEFQVKHLGFADAKAEDFYVSQWFKHKGLFVAYRMVIFLYSLFWAIYDTIVLYPKYPDFWVYLTEWGEFSLAVYFAVALGVALYGLIRGSDGPESQGCCFWNKCNKGDLRWFHHLQWELQSAITAVAYIITIMYWSFLAYIQVVSVEANIHQHVMNSVLVTLELFINRVPVRFLHFIYASSFGLTYGIFTLILHGSGFKSRFYPGILDWEKVPGLSAGVIFGLMLVGAPILHAIVFGLYHLRALIARGCGCSSPHVLTDDVEMGGTGNARNGSVNKGFEE